MKCWPALTMVVAAYAADPQQVWEQALKAKGGRERLHGVHSLAIFLKPAQVNLAGPPTTWFCGFPDRYFEFEGRGSGPDSPRAIMVNETIGRVAMDAMGIPRAQGPLTEAHRERLTLNQVVFLLESAWLEPHPVTVKGKVLTVEAGGRTFRLYINREDLPERVQALPAKGREPKNLYDYRLEHYREVQGVQLPARLTWISGMRQWTWDADYEVDAKYNPKFFERMPDLADGPEPWRKP